MAQTIETFWNVVYEAVRNDLRINLHMEFDENKGYQVPSFDEILQTTSLDKDDLVELLQVYGDIDETQCDWDKMSFSPDGIFQILLYCNTPHSELAMSLFDQQGLQQLLNRVLFSVVCNVCDAAKCSAKSVLRCHTVQVAAEELCPSITDDWF